MIDVLLVMPPVSEAFQFPYLAMPQLAAAWSAQGYTVRCVDLNLAYRDAVLCRVPADESKPRRDGVPAAPAAAAKDVYRIVSERYRRSHGELLLARSRDRTSAAVQAMAIRAIGRYVSQQATEDGWVLHDSLRLTTLEQKVWASSGNWSAIWCLDRLKELLNEHRPRVLAFTVPFFSQVIPVLTLATLLKEADEDVPIMVGGPTVQMWADLLRANVPATSTVDYWCLGHGETYLSQVLPTAGRKAYTQGQRPRQTTLVAAETGGLSDGLRLNEQPPPDFRQFDFTQYSNEAHQFPYRLTLGCFWGKCTFCSYGNRYHDARAFQQIKPELAAEQLVALARLLQINDVAIADENTGLRHLVRIMSAVRRRGAMLTFRVRARLEPDLADPAFCRKLRALGCVQISAGFETAEQKLLDVVLKGQQVREAEQAVANLKAAGICINLSFMEGYAHPAATTGFEATVSTIQRNAATMGLDTMQLLVAEPGSHLWDNRWSVPGDDEFLITNDGLAFAAGRVGAPTADPPAAEAARQRLLRMMVVAVPDAERMSRPDLMGRREDSDTAPKAALEATHLTIAQAGGAADPNQTDGVALHGAGPKNMKKQPPLHAWPRAGVTLDTVRDRRVLADIAWPRMATVPSGISQTWDGALEAVGPQAQRWMTRMLEKRLLVWEHNEAEIV